MTWPVFFFIFSPRCHRVEAASAFIRNRRHPELCDQCDLKILTQETRTERQIASGGIQQPAKPNIKPSSTVVLSFFEGFDRYIPRVRNSRWAGRLFIPVKKWGNLDVLTTLILDFRNTHPRVSHRRKHYFPLLTLWFIRFSRMQSPEIVSCRSQRRLCSIAHSEQRVAPVDRGKIRL